MGEPMKCVVALAVNKRSANPNPLELDLEMSARYISKILKKMGWEPVTVEMSSNIHESKNSLRKLHPEFVFKLLDSFAESGEMVQFMTMLLSDLSVPFTGVDSTVFSFVNDKLKNKNHLLAAGLPTPHGGRRNCLG